jgi:GR25 family glycosyltransferase involved in LPS biosynthesis
MNLGKLPFLLFHAGYSFLAIKLQEILCLIDPKPIRTRILEFLRNGSKLRSAKWDGEQEYPVYVLNREKDKKRMNSFRMSCKKWGILFERIQAVNCADRNFDYRDYDSRIAPTFYAKTKFLRGSVGCFLSHAKAWRSFLDSKAELAMVCEDDARFLGPIPKRVADYDFSAETDLVFVNQRMAEGLISDEGAENLVFFKFVPAFPASIRLLDAIPHLTATGGEGYILTRSGAQKLITLLDEKKIFMDVDWLIFLQSLTLEERQEFMAKDKTGRFEVLEFSPIKLNAYVMLPALVEHLGEDSIISYLNPENYIEREDMRKAPSSLHHN